MKISVGDLAEQIMAQDAVVSKGALHPPTLAPDPSFYSANVTEQAPDISQVVVPDDFVNCIVEGTAPVIPEVTVEEDAPLDPQPISEVTELKGLIQEVKDLLIEVKQTLVEMTTVGAIGVNMAPPKKSKEPQEKDPMKAILQRIKKNKRKASP